MTKGDILERNVPEQGTPFLTIAAKDAETEIDLRELCRCLFEHIKLILFTAVLGASLSFAYTYFCVTPMYEATSKLYVINSSDSALNLSDLQIGSYLASDYIEVSRHGST
jgi:capsular polysaccharide biosynthesis protein